MSAALQQPDSQSPVCSNCRTLVAFIRRDGKVRITHGDQLELQRLGLDVVIPSGAQIRRLVPVFVGRCRAGHTGEVADE